MRRIRKSLFIEKQADVVICKRPTSPKLQNPTIKIFIRVNLMPRVTPGGLVKGLGQIERAPQNWTYLWGDRAARIISINQIST